ncbi:MULTISPECIES: DUF3017 domain-containing protein [unclassified Streptomyces]|uniref:DUF3017 domain-containing protein n=1 Tax=unclassified Streptomyces TaxID=2593676 RepID=UPI0011E84BB9|nr:DUF3017 domain-containing protein [Streptomyces sp. sk2.1]TXS66879.1 DUF3017 domain-containing protein [Streptomyces sp. sk2.1]
MGAGTSPADPTAEDTRTDEAPETGAGTGAGTGAETGAGPGKKRTGPEPEKSAAGGGARPDADAGEDAGEEAVSAAPADVPGPDSGKEAGSGTDTAPDAAPAASGSTRAGGSGTAPRASRRFPLFTKDTARPEGGGRAAPGDAPAPARQWPLLAVLCTAGIGLLIVAVDPFAEAFRVGTMLIGAALIGGAVLRMTVRSVGMLAVRSRFTDLVTYGVLGFLIVMLALVAQPKPWLDVPFLEQVVHFTIR